MRDRLLTLLKRGWDALFPIPQVGQTEAFLLRSMLAYVLWYFLPGAMDQVSQPVPVGLAHWFDLTWMANPAKFAAFKSAFLVVAFWCASGIGLPVSLPVLTLLHVLPYTLYNSQGHPHHGYQIMSLSLLAMSTATITMALRGRRAEGPKMNLAGWIGLVVSVLAASRLLVIWEQFGRANGLSSLPFFVLSLIVFVALSGFMLHVLRRVGARVRPHADTNAWLLVSGQYMIAVAYFISVVTKMVRSKGEWLINSHYVALDFVKTMRQSYYSSLNPAFARDPEGVVFLMQHENLARLFFDGGVILETVLILAVGTRRLALVFGLAAIAMHESIKALMTLTFPTHESMVALFFVNIPFLLAAAWEKMMHKSQLPIDQGIQAR